jgi:hypothetical protein
MDDRVVVGLFEVVAISLVPVGIVWAGVHAHEIVERSVVIGRRAHLLPPPPQPPAGPPLEKLASQLRRLRPEARTPRPGVRMARQRGIVAAYDEVLVATAAALDVPTTLCDLPDGLDREAERLRLEDALETAGLSWQIRQD